jgi:hypothetical protein
MWRGRIRFTTCTVIGTWRANVRKQAKKMGRPISFDKYAALPAAMLLFWDRSYEVPSPSNKCRRSFRYAKCCGKAMDRMAALKKNGLSGRRGGTRTHDPLLRRQMLYPPELRAQTKAFLILNHVDIPTDPLVRLGALKSALISVAGLCSGRQCSGLNYPFL